MLPIKVGFIFLRNSSEKQKQQQHQTGSIHEAEVNAKETKIAKQFFSDIDNLLEGDDVDKRKAHNQLIEKQDQVIIIKINIVSCFRTVVND